MPEHSLGASLPLWSTLPFAGILLSIALGPVLAPAAWHRHYPKVVIAWAFAFAAPFVFAFHGQALHEIAHVLLLDYVPFLILLGGLYIVAGGVVIRGTPAATPLVNTCFLAAGTLLASWIGTTGAAMLLIRPLLRANAGRKASAHVIVFFTFLVANVGGALTPLGDPPLFLGYLHGVPFFWTLRLLPATAFVATSLLALFFALDWRAYRRERGTSAPFARADEPLRVGGTIHFAYLAGIVGVVLLSGVWRAGHIALLGVELPVEGLVRDAGIVLIAVLSFASTPVPERKRNGFTFGPMREVAWLFAGIFVTIVPMIAILKAGEHGAFARWINTARTPVHYFWMTGLLSSVLDNAPTYLSFFNGLLGRFTAPGQPEAEAVALVIARHDLYLQAVAAGAVFMGALTYLGNAPNFMVKLVAEEAGVAMPSLFGYVFRWALPFLVPVLVLTGWLFF